ncbi:MAG: tRNA (guanosine(46)-N7)-methyltransferase TrmB [Rhodoblastus sp.]
MADFLPTVAVDLSGGALSPDKLFSFPHRELRLEIGFGDGERLIEQASAAPDIAFLGCEPFLNGVAKTISAIEDRDLANIRIHAGDARELLATLPAQSLDRIELLYPDPWPKRRHHKRRIVSDEFLSAAARVLKPGCELRFATDIDDYCAWTLAHIGHSKHFAWEATRPDDWLKPWEGWFATRYEKKARLEGRPSAYLTFVRNGAHTTI